MTGLINKKKAQRAKSNLNALVRSNSPLSRAGYMKEDFSAVRQHMVQVEGFSIDELDGKLKNVIEE